VRRGLESPWFLIKSLRTTRTVKTLAQILSLFLFFATARLANSEEAIRFSSSDVVAFIGGGDVAAAQFTGHLESLLARDFPGTRFRNFGWEGDTVFAQPRDFNFPPLKEHLKKARVTVAIVQFGRTEALSDERADFKGAYLKVLSEIQQNVPRVVVITPIPFERPVEPLPDLSKRNDKIRKMSETIREIAKEKNLPIIDLFRALDKQTGRLTEDGLQLTPFGHSIVARAFVDAIGIKSADSATADGKWQNAKLEHLRQTVIAKNRLWFNYWRPQNWAFLGGDRTEQPSSRDHRDPKIRWFPQEMEQYPLLIAGKEQEIASLVSEK
jgi:hypothetical protein